MFPGSPTVVFIKDTQKIPQPCIRLGHVRLYLPQYCYLRHALRIRGLHVRLELLIEDVVESDTGRKRPAYHQPSSLRDEKG